MRPGSGLMSNLLERATILFCEKPLGTCNTCSDQNNRRLNYETSKIVLLNGVEGARRVDYCSRERRPLRESLDAVRTGPRGKCFDGSTSIAFDAASSDKQWCGLDFGIPKFINQIRYFPRSGNEARAVGGMFQVSTTPDFSGDSVYTMYNVTSQPSAKWYSVPGNVVDAFQYARYLSPNGGWGNIAEVEFYGF